MSDAIVKARLVLEVDPSVSSSISKTNSEIDKIGPAAQRSAGQAVQALNAFGETSEQAGIRIGQMVKASLDANKAVEAERAALIAATDARRAASAAVDIDTTARKANADAAARQQAAITASMVAMRDEVAVLNSVAVTSEQVAAKRAALESLTQKRVLSEEELANATKQLQKAEADLVVQSERLAQSQQKASQVQQSQLQSLARQYDPVSAGMQKIQKDEALLNDLFLKGQVSGTQYVKMLAEMGAQRGALTESSKGATSLSSALSGLTLNTTNTRREFGLLMKDLATGQTGLATREFGTLAANTGLMSVAFNLLKNPVLAAAAAIGVLSAALYILGQRTANELQGFNKQLVLTGNSSIETAAQVKEAANEIGQSTGRWGDAREAMTQLLATGKFVGQELKDAAAGAVAFAELTGESVDKAASAFTKLANDPLKASQELDAQFHYLSVSQLQQIANFTLIGDKASAGAIAVKAFSTAMVERNEEVQKTLTGWAALWRDITSEIGAAVTKIGDYIYAHKQAIAESAKQAFNTTPGGAALNLGSSLGSAIGSEFAKHPSFSDVQSGTNTPGYMAALTTAMNNAQTAIGKVQTKFQDLAKTQQQVDDIQKKNIVTITTETEALQKQLEQGDKSNVAKVNALQAASLRELANVTGLSTEAFAQQRAAIEASFVPLRQQAAIADAAAKALKDHGKAAKEAGQAAVELDRAGDALDNMLDNLEGKTNLAAKAQSEYKKGMRDLENTVQAFVIAGGNADDALAKWQRGEEQLKANLDQTNDTLAKRADVLGDFKQKMADQAALDNLSAREKAVEQAVQALTKSWLDNVKAGVTNKQILDDVRDGAKEAAAANYDLSKQSKDLNDILKEFGKDDPFERMNNSLALLQNRLAQLQNAVPSAFNDKEIKRVQTAIDGVNKSMEQRNIGLMQEGIRSVQQYAKEGTAAYTALGIAQDILAYKAAITAIATQGTGDPYTAFARIAAMIALMASIGIRIAGGGNSGPDPNSAEVRQQTQGTGSVLGDAQAKSDSIAKAIDITAKATTALVGINRGMLTALQALQNALGAAGTQLAQGAGNAKFPGIGGSGLNILDPLGMDPIGGAIGNFLFGGSKSVIDEGIQVVGGTIQSMINGIVIGAYQTIHKDGGLFGSDKTYDQLSSLGDQFNKQFQLVIKSIADTVKQGALALGISQADIDSRLAQYKVEATKISLKGLSGEDQQKALEAVFSKIFDGLAGAVVPFIGQFQQVGEGLGETLVRVATEVQVTQEAFKQLGINVNETDPEKFAQISDALVQAAGGLDNFISGLQSFVNNFASSGQQLMMNAKALTSAFSGVGLTLPPTADGLWQLMQSLDATTEQGRKQIALLLSLTDAEKAYYDALAQAKQTLQNAYYTPEEIAKQNVDSTRTQATSLLTALGIDPTISMADFRKAYEAALPTLTPEQVAQWVLAGNALAAATSAQTAYNKVLEDGAKAQADAMQAAWDAVNADIANRQHSTDDIIKNTADYFTQVQALADEAGRSGNSSEFLSAIANIQQWERSTENALNSAAKAAGMQAAAETDLSLVHQIAAQRVAAAIQTLLKETQDLVSQFYGGSSSSSTGNSGVGTFIESNSNGMNALAQQASKLWQDQLDAVKSIQDYLDSQLLGDTSALTPQQKIDEALRQFTDAQKAALGGDADAAKKLPQLADTYLRLLRGSTASGDDYNSQATNIRKMLEAVTKALPVGSKPPDSTTNGPGSGLSQTLDNYENKVADTMTKQREQLALQLAEHLRDLSGSLKVNVFDLMNTMGVKLTDLTSALHIDLKNITGQSVTALGQLSTALGVSMAVLTNKLGLNLTDLGNGVRELEAKLGINLEHMTGQSVQALYTLAQSLNLSLDEILQTTGNSLKDIKSGLLDMTNQLGIDFNNITSTQVRSLITLGQSLGLSLTQVTEATGHNLIDLRAGMKQLTDSLHIDLSNMTVQSTGQLATLAQSLGIKLTEVAASLGIDLGKLTDSQSLLNQSLGQAIDGLPAEQKNQLEPLFQAVTNATTEADANAAITQLVTAVNSLPPGLRDKLAPYLDGVIDATNNRPLDYQAGLYAYAGQQVSLLTNIADKLGVMARSQELNVPGTPTGGGVPGPTAPPRTPVPGGPGPGGRGVPGFAVGTEYVPYDQIAMVHQGEKIIDPASSAILSKYGIKVQGEDNSALLAEIRLLREEVEALRRESGLNASTQNNLIKSESAADRANRDRNTNELKQSLNSKARSTQYG